MSEASPLHAHDMPPARHDTMLLVIDDHPDHREAVREALEDEGYCVETAVHGRDALDRVLTGRHPDLILLDLKMPVMDGWAFMVELKAHDDLAVIPVVMMSGAGEQVLNSAPVGAGYLAKPLDRSRLLQTVAICLSRRHS